MNYDSCGYEKGVSLPQHPGGSDDKLAHSGKSRQVSLPQHPSARSRSHWRIETGNVALQI
jgi:hypothetical protein